MSSTINYLQSNQTNKINYHLNKNCLAHKLRAQLPIRVDNPFLSKEITLLLTSRCNIRCKYCYNYQMDGLPHAKMSPLLAVRFLQDYLAYQNSIEMQPPLRQVVFSGGEPTLNPDTIFSVLDFIKVNKLRYLPVILTNGIFKDELLNRLIDEMVAFQISFDGSRNIMRRTHKGAEVHEQIVSTIKKIASTHAPIILRSTVTTENLYQMSEVVEFAAEHGIESVRFAPLHVSPVHKINTLEHNELDLLRPSSSEYVTELFNAYELGCQLDVNVYLPELLRYNNCGKFQEFPRLVLAPDGSISMRSGFLTAQAAKLIGAEETIIGRCDITNGIDINTDRLIKLSMNYLANQAKHCQGCECEHLCRGRNQNYYLFTETHLDTKDDFSCEITRKTFKELNTREFKN